MHTKGLTYINPYKQIVYWITAFLLLLSSYAFAQPSLSFSYAYLHNPSLDKIFQTYNTARPWQEDKLYPLTHSIEATMGWNWELLDHRQLHLLPYVGYAHIATTAENSGQKLRVGLHRTDIALAFRFHPKALIKGVQNVGPLGTRWFMTATPGYSFFCPFIKMNSEPLMLSEDEKYKPTSGSFFFNIGIGHHLMMLKGRFIITPELAATWHPNIEIKDLPQSVNGHNITGLNGFFENVFFLQAKLRVTMVKPTKNWWDVPVRGR